MMWITARLHERSTWAGLLALVSLALGRTFPETVTAGITDAGVILAGVLAALMPEREA